MNNFQPLGQSFPQKSCAVDIRLDYSYASEGVINPFMTEIPIIWKAVTWSVQSNGLVSIWRDLRHERVKQISSETLAGLAEVVLKKSIFTLHEKTFKQKCGITIKAKFTSPYTILFMAGFEKRFRNFWKESKDLLEIHKRYIFHIGAWKSIFEKFCRAS